MKTDIVLSGGALYVLCVAIKTYLAAPRAPHLFHVANDMLAKCAAIHDRAQHEQRTEIELIIDAGQLAIARDAHQCVAPIFARGESPLAAEYSEELAAALSPRVNGKRPGVDQ